MDVNVLNDLLQSILSDAEISGVTVTGYGPASLGNNKNKPKNNNYA